MLHLVRLAPDGSGAELVFQQDVGRPSSTHVPSGGEDLALAAHGSRLFLGLREHEPESDLRLHVLELDTLALP